MELLVCSVERDGCSYRQEAPGWAAEAAALMGSCVESWRADTKGTVNIFTESDPGAIF